MNIIIVSVAVLFLLLSLTLSKSFLFTFFPQSAFVRGMIKFFCALVIAAILMLDGLAADNYCRGIWAVIVPALFLTTAIVSFTRACKSISWMSQFVLMQIFIMSSCAFFYSVSGILLYYYGDNYWMDHGYKMHIPNLFVGILLFLVFSLTFLSIGVLIKEAILHVFKSLFSSLYNVVDGLVIAFTGIYTLIHCVSLAIATHWIIAGFSLIVLIFGFAKGNVIVEEQLDMEDMSTNYARKIDDTHAIGSDGSSYTRGPNGWKKD